MIISHAIDKYLQRVKSRSVATERTYATGLRRFQEYIDERGLPSESTDVAALTPPVFQDYIAWLDEYLLRGVAEGDKRHVSQSTKKTYLAAVLGFLDYLVVGTQLVEIDGRVYDTLRRDLARAGKRRGSRTLSPDKVPSVEIVQALLDQARQPLRPPHPSGATKTRRQKLIRLRNLAIVEALVSSGMRVGELVGLDREHLLHDTKGAVVKHGKGGKERTVLFSHPAWRAIQAYLSERRDEFRYRSVGPLPVFSRHDRRAGTRVLRLSTRAVQNVLWKLASQAEILEKFHLTPHSLRHFFATEFRKRTGDLALTQRALGHASPVTTDIYSKADDEEYKEAYRDAFGSGRPSDP